MNRRAFLAMGTWAALGMGRAPRAFARALGQDGFSYGESRLGISDDERDATLYVPFHEGFLRDFYEAMEARLAGS